MKLKLWVFEANNLKDHLFLLRFFFFVFFFLHAVRIGKELMFVWYIYYHLKGFPGSSAGKESACHAGDPSLIPGSGRSTGEGISYPLQYFWASLMAQRVKNLPTMQETWVSYLKER